uniref:Si:ch73-71c20.5 n=1 Tax=Myripristis murdjan TaxID=586833 RepID=A0A667Z0H2_9TELE
MAAPCTTFVRSVLKGVRFVPGQWLQTHRCQNTAVPVCLRLQAARCRQLHVSPAASMSGTKAESQQTAGTKTDDRKAKKEEEEEEEEEGGPEYIPRRKAKNPMMKIGFAWMIGLPSGIIGFILAKREVDKNRLKQLRIRQRMRRSNEGEYEGSRYRNQAAYVKLDQ